MLKHSSEQAMLTEPEKTFLERLRSRAKTEQRLALRANILLALDEGRSVSQIARDLHLVRNTVTKWRDRWLAAQNRLLQAGDAFEALALEMLGDAPRKGKPANFTPEQITQIIALSCEPPQESGRPITNWTQRELAREAQKRGIVKQISHRSVGRFLKRSRSQAASESVLAQQQTG
jgi:putative transposase